MTQALATLVLASILSLSDSVSLAGLVVLVVSAITIGRRRSKDRTISDLEAALRAKEVLLETQRAELLGVQDRANAAEAALKEAEHDRAHLQGEIKTLERYTAQSALEQVGRELAALQAAVVSAVNGQGDLVLESHAILKQLGDQLRVNGELIERLSRRLAA